VYVTDESQRLLGVLSFRELFAAAPDALVRDVMLSDPVTAGEQDDQEELGRRFAEHDLMAIPVVDEEGRMKGIVTVDDIMDVVEEEATEDIQKFGGVQALEKPYLEMGFAGMLRKRAPWLSVSTSTPPGCHPSGHRGERLRSPTVRPSRRTWRRRASPSSSRGSCLSSRP
jgi:magnesium transporter